MKPRPSIIAAKQHFTKTITAAEVGVFQGDNALSMLQELNPSHIYLIDPYVKFIEPSSKMGRTDDFPKNEQVARDKLKDYEEKCIWIKKRGDEAYIPIVDFVYIDGSHEYENVIKDLQYFYTRIRPGGILAGHDWRSPGVNKAVIEFARANDLKINRASPDWWFYL